MINKTFTVLGTIFIIGSGYTGLALAGILPEPYPFFGGWLFGSVPTVLAIAGTVLISSPSPEEDENEEEVV